MRIYVASSWRNEHQQAVVAALRESGHLVYDFKNPGPEKTGFHWTSITDQPRPWPPEKLAEVLKHPIAKAGFSTDMEALSWADACVLVLPCGRSAHLELGWAGGAGKYTSVLMLAPDEPELMYLMLNEPVLGSIAEVVAWADDTAKVVAIDESRKLPSGNLTVPDVIGALVAVKRARACPIVDDDFPRLIHEADRLVADALAKAGAA